MDRTLVEKYAAGAAVPGEAIRGLTAAELNTFPVPGTWSIQQIVTDAGVDALERGENVWRVRAGSTSLTAATVIDAAGAWADEIARLAGVEPVGLQPRRRTALTVDLPAGIDARAWPFVGDVEERFYFRPEGGRLLLSLADETLSPPCDAQPEDEDVAEAVDRVERATTLSFNRVVSAWAGLRSFVRDRRPVIGYDETAFAKNLHYEKLDPVQACEVFRINRLLTATVLRNLPDAAFARHGIHSERGRETLEELVIGYTEHVDHHMKFIKEKRKLLGKPL